MLDYGWSEVLNLCGYYYVMKVKKWELKGTVHDVRDRIMLRERGRQILRSKKKLH